MDPNRQVLYHLDVAVPHEYPNDWADGDWLVPTSSGHAVIRHGHDDPSDHTACGPTLFCCSRSARLFTQAFPQTPESQAQWQLINQSTVLSWIGGGVQVVYFVFCDQEDGNRLRAIGVTAPGAEAVVSRERSLDSLSEEANLLDVAPDHDVIFKLLRDREDK